MFGRLSQKLARRLWRRARSENGSASVEFVIVFPLFMLMFFSIFETGIMMTRYMMFERGLDVTVRAMKLTPNGAFSHDEVRNRICEETLIIRNCYDDLRLEMTRLDADETDWKYPSSNVRCVVRDEDIEVNNDDFASGNENDTMYIRACMTLRPMFHWAGFGASMTLDDNNEYQMIAVSAFSVEPK